jgi:acetoin utilization deacetylase AcuC-like enzyme
VPLALVNHPAYNTRPALARRYPISKYARLMEVLAADGVIDHCVCHEPEPASYADLTRAHGRRYVERVFAQTLDAAETRRIGFPLSDAIVVRSRAAAGGTVLCGRLALEHGLALNTAGGSHHAFADFGAGYCVFNDVAVAARALKAEDRVGQVLVVDLDVHQGDGTAAIFADDPGVFTFSVHCQDNFPARKQMSDLDIGLAAGTGDDAYLSALAAHLDRVIETVAPDLVFYNAGVDPHAEDRLGRLALTDAGLAERDAMVLGACMRRRVPLACVLGGGYSDDLDRLAKRHAILFKTALAVAAVAGSNGA